MISEEPIIVRVLESQEMSLVHTLRKLVWQETKSGTGVIPDWLIEDEFDRNAIHWGAFHQGQLVAACRLSYVVDRRELSAHKMYSRLAGCASVPLCLMERLVVRQDYTGNGLAARLDQERILKAWELGVDRILVGVPPYRVPGLMKLGFKIAGSSAEEFVDAGLPPAVLLFLPRWLSSIGKPNLTHASYWSLV